MTSSDPAAPGDPTGHVSPGGPAWILPVPGAVVRKFSVSDMDNNVYLLTCGATSEHLLVDAADDADRILAELDLAGGGLGQVVTTHRHWDHSRALEEVVRRTGARTLAGDADADELPVPTGTRLTQGDTVHVGRLTLDVLALRGHTPGSVALALTVPDHPVVLLTGDSLFPGGPGRTGGAEDFASLMDALEERVFAVYAAAPLVLPGHGDNTTLGAERPQLARWRERGW